MSLHVRHFVTSRIRVLRTGRLHLLLPFFSRFADTRPQRRRGVRCSIDLRGVYLHAPVEHIAVPHALSDLVDCTSRPYRECVDDDLGLFVSKDEQNFVQRRLHRVFVWRERRKRPQPFLGLLERQALIEFAGVLREPRVAVRRVEANRLYGRAPPRSCVIRVASCWRYTVPSIITGLVNIMFTPSVKRR